MFAAQYIANGRASKFSEMFEREAGPLKEFSNSGFLL